MSASGKVWVLLSSLPKSSNAVVVSRITSCRLIRDIGEQITSHYKIVTCAGCSKEQTTERRWFYSLMTIN